MSTELQKMSIPSLLAPTLAARPDAPALIVGEDAISYRELDTLSRRAAQGLAELGVGPGDRVALWLPNVPAWPILQLACCHLGAIAVAVNTRFRSLEVADIVSRSGAKVLAMYPGFKQIDFLGILAGIDPAALQGLESVVIYGEATGEPPAALQRLRLVPYADLLEKPALAESRASGEAPCNMFTTSGTTKAPKFVLHRQGAIAAHVARVARAFGFHELGTCHIAMLPFCGVFGFDQTLAALAAGAPLVLMELFDARQAAELIRRHQVSHLFGSDEMMDRLLAAVPEPVAFPSVRWGGFAGFNTSLSDIVARADARGLKLCGLYGMSEVQALFSVQPATDPVAQRAEGGGFPISPFARVRVRDPETGALLSHGEQGELEIAGPSCMVGYYGNEEATRQTFTADGYVRTGDLGFTQEDGRFVFLTRMGDVLRIAGFLVSPLEIESHLQAHPSVEGAQVVAVARPEGMRAVAFVVLRPGAAFDPAALKAHCEGALANFKVPVGFFAVEDFPRTPSANGFKIQRNKLREMALERLDGPAATAAASTAAPNPAEPPADQAAQPVSAEPPADQAATETAA